ncbi:MAG: hypothetical protein H0V66_14225 [Bdellovibrionales bacterium]|nr:hypothetical protein [Bdellovibrionales bacterium]
MKFSLFFILSLFAFNAYSLDFPKSPDVEITPGSLCDHPDSYRYAEQIPYCERDVSSRTKSEIFETYRDELGYVLDLSNRSNYKIDHYIPLCAGGSNNDDNLWPQHISVFTITDPIESVGCEKLKAGRILQKNLVALIRQAKLNLSDAPRILKNLQSL